MRDAPEEEWEAGSHSLQLDVETQHLCVSVQCLHQVSLKKKRIFYRDYCFSFNDKAYTLNIKHICVPEDTF